MQNTNRLLFLITAMFCFFTHPATLLAEQMTKTPKTMLEDLYLLKDTKTKRISSWDKSGANRDWLVLNSGETKTLAEMSGTGVIRRFYVASAPGDRMRYRKVVLRMYWDGEEEPAVEVPLGDFFGSGLGSLRYIHSILVDVNPGFSIWDFDGMSAYFPMPFSKGARITLENDSVDMDNFRIWYHIEYEQLAEGALPENAGRFHARWNRVEKAPVAEGVLKNDTLGNVDDKNLTGEDNYLILETLGQGTLVGLFLTVDNIAGGWYGEGDDMIFIDGERWPPSYHGTGHEEVFDAGCCPDVEYAGLYTGFYLIEHRGHAFNFGGKNQMYRFYVNNPVRFQESIKVGIEHGHNNNYENDYTSTAFWYQKGEATPHPELPPVEDRLPQWQEGVQTAIDKEAEINAFLTDFRLAGKTMKPEDSQKLLTLQGETNKAFKGLRHDEYIKKVDEIEEMIDPYR